jgi:dodecin
MIGATLALVCRPGVRACAICAKSIRVEEKIMPNKSYKIVDVVGVSDQSIQQAVRNAITKAQQTLRNIDWFEVGPIRGAVHSGDQVEFQVEVRIGFRLEDAPVS